MVWIEFLICSALLTFFAYNLCKEGVVISEKTHIEEGVIGMFFLAIATSFPEIVTASTAVYSLDKVALGYGDIVGSVIVNLMILTVLDVMNTKGRVLRNLSRVNKLTGLFALIVTSIVLLGVFLRKAGVFVPSVRGFGLENILVVVSYFVCLKYVHDQGGEIHPEVVAADKSESIHLAWAKFGIFLFIVMLLGIWMANVGEKIVLTSGISETFTGTLLLGFATSLPEIIVSITALKAGSANMAVGNILGSNLFDMCVIPFLDVLTQTPILGLLGGGPILATVTAGVLSLIAVLGMKAKAGEKSRLGMDTALIFIVGLASFVLLYFMK